MKIAPKHDFVAKLQQESVAPAVKRYVEWQRAARKARAEGAVPPTLPAIPLLSVNLDLTTGCNFRCSHCVDWDNLNTGIHHDDRQLFESLSSLIAQGLRSAILIGGGEPTVHRGFCAVVRFLKEHGVQVGIVSNGSRGEVLEEAALTLTSGDWIRLSLDSGRNQTFLTMHRPRNAKMTLECICASVPRIRRANPQVQVGFSFIITWDGAKRTKDVSIVSNLDEIVPATRLAQDYQFSYISFKPFLTRFPDGAEVMNPAAMAHQAQTLEKIRGALAEARGLETPEFRVLESTNLRVLMQGNWHDLRHQPKTCHMMVFRQVLSPLGVFHCPAKRGDGKARVGKKDAFTEDELVKTRAALDNMLEYFDASRECAEITCLYNAANWWLEGLTRDGAEVDVVPDRGDYYL